MPWNIPAIYYKSLADQGDAEAQCYVGLKYLIGEETVKNDITAFHYLKLAADQGHPTAQYAVGALYLRSRIALEEDSSAFYYFKLAVDQGPIEPQHGIPHSYYYARGAPEDFQNAYHYLKLAADQGLGAAQYLMFLLFPDGEPGYLSQEIITNNPLQGVDNLLQDIATEPVYGHASGNGGIKGDHFLDLPLPQGQHQQPVNPPGHARTVGQPML